ncbi:MAG: NusG domain II-containing protein [Oscillospiraceae bacterium]|nr:NusG domain II-containing protein [Oscillospiraceae bacterium]
MIFFSRRPANYAKVYQDGILIATLDLSAYDEPYTFVVQWESFENVIEVENGRIRIAHADCPDNFCVHQGWISGGARPIVCLPHRLIIQLENPTKPQVDAIVG